MALLPGQGVEKPSFGIAVTSSFKTCKVQEQGTTDQQEPLDEDVTQEMREDKRILYFSSLRLFCPNHSWVIVQKDSWIEPVSVSLTNGTQTPTFGPQADTEVLAPDYTLLPALEEVDKALCTAEGAVTSGTGTTGVDDMKTRRVIQLMYVHVTYDFTYKVVYFFFFFF